MENYYWLSSRAKEILQSQISDSEESTQINTKPIRLKSVHSEFTILRAYNMSRWNATIFTEDFQLLAYAEVINPILDLSGILLLLLVLSKASLLIWTWEWTRAKPSTHLTYRIPNYGCHLYLRGAKQIWFLDSNVTSKNVGLESKRSITLSNRHFYDLSLHPQTPLSKENRKFCEIKIACIARGFWRKKKWIVFHLEKYYKIT